MNERPGVDSPEQLRLRRAVYALMIVIVVALIGSRVATVRSRPGRTPMLSANDRSRWSTVRSLVELGTYELDEVIFVGPEKKRSAEWHTIDLVRHRGGDGREHYYSSKPPLLATMIAALYWPLHKFVGWTMRYDALPTIRLLLVIVQVIPLAFAFVLLAAWAERYGRTNWGRMAWFAAATFGTFLTTFATTLNNHLPAAICALAATYVGLRIVHDGRRTALWFGAGGLFAAFAAAFELPALSFTALISTLLLYCDPRRTLLFYVPSAALVVAAFFMTNYWAHGTWRPAYSSRSDGPVLARISTPELTAPQPLPEDLISALRSEGVEVTSDAVLEQRPSGRGWQIWDPQLARRYAARWSGNELTVRDWGNWYEYERSYWLDGIRRGVDRGERDPKVYAFHVLIGHHGVFSLTPLWLLAIWGTGRWIRSGDRVLAITALAIVLITVVCFAFYLTRPLIDRNYGGMTSGFRWSFWLIPLWLWLLLPAVDDLGSHAWGRAVVLLLLAVSVFSAHYASGNPWSHPWIFDWWTWQDWIDYA